MAKGAVQNRKVNVVLSDKIFDIINYILMGIILIIVVYPLYFVVIASISDPTAVARGETFLFPKGFNFDGYEKIITDAKLWNGYKNTILYTTVGVIVNIAVTMTCAYALAKKDLVGGRLIAAIIIFTMLFDGGMIPRYLIVRNLGLYNTFWAMVLPKSAWVFCIIIARTFIQETIPQELYEAAQVEGCSFSRYFFSVVIPLSPPLISILLLYYGVGHWNSFFDAMIYLKDRSLYPLQLILREILITNQNQAQMMAADSPEAIMEMMRISESIKYGVVIFSSVPVLMLYPFLQKYFVKGVMIGAIKG